MKAARIRSFGGPDVVEICDTNTPEPQAREVLVTVEAASVNPLDLKIIAGYMREFFPVEFPYVPGTDFSGIVEAVGAQVTHLTAGDRVVGRSAPAQGGAFARGVTIPAADLCVIPANMSFEQAAALPTALGTARQALFETGRLQQGQRVLVHAGAGGVGSFAIQLARRAGAHVVATTSAANLELARSLGAHEVIDYRSESMAHLSGIDLVLDTVGGETLAKSWSVLRSGGRIATLIDFAIRPTGDKSGEFVFFKGAGESLPDAMKLFGSGDLQIVIDSIFSLDEVREGLKRVATGHVRGKVIIQAKHSF